MTTGYRKVLGWLAVGLSTLAACFWAFWGIIENFHEGWYSRSLVANLGMMFVQYLSPMIVFLTAGLVAIRWPRVGGMLHLAAAGLAAWFFREASPLVVYASIAGPLAFMGIAYWLGSPQPRRWAVRALVGCSLLTLLICGVEPIYRVATRQDDGDRSLRLIEGNGVELVWAPAGPGWPGDGVPWAEAVHRCQHLTADGLSLSDTPQHIWRLPTTDEIIRSLTRHGQNAGGSWDGSTGWARFSRRPDKESPLWNPHSRIIYWWTSTEAEPDRAMRVCYNGHVVPVRKQSHFGYLGFRAVSPVKDDSSKSN